MVRHKPVGQPSALADGAQVLLDEDLERVPFGLPVFLRGHEDEPVNAFPEMADVGPDQGRNVAGPHSIHVAQLVGKVFNAAVVGVGVAEIGRIVLDDEAVGVVREDVPELVEGFAGRDGVVNGAASRHPRWGSRPIAQHRIRVPAVPDKEPPHSQNWSG